MIYLDNAATTMRKPQEVIDAITAAMCSMGNAGRGVNEASLGAARTVYDTREKLAGFFRGGRCKTDRIYHEFNGESEYCNQGDLKSGRPCDLYGFGT